MNLNKGTVMKFLVLIALMMADPVAFAETYNSTNNPNNFNRIAGLNLVTKFDALPLIGTLADNRMGWSESYWPSNKGGIAFRWNHPDPQPFKYRLHSREEIRQMSIKDLERLSPAELYDIANNDYQYTLTKSTLRKYTVHDLWWEGICHGWAQAASHYPEPAAVVVKNNDGVKVPFGSSDVKALLAMHEAYNFGGKFGFVGARCKASGKVEGEGDERDRNPNPPLPEIANSPDCKDVNAGAFHVVITNMIGLLGRGFVADIDRFGDVWNQPITNYAAEIAGEEPVTPEHRQNRIERRVRVNLKMTYGEELKFWTRELAASGARNFVSKLPVTGTPNQKYLSKGYTYIVELDFNGNVIGGEWISGTRPDFLWMFERSREFKNQPVPLAHLKYIYQPVRR
jgi:hypothetical protein